MYVEKDLVKQSTVSSKRKEWQGVKKKKFTSC